MLCIVLIFYNCCIIINKMKVKILSSSLNCWYKHQVGNIINVIEHENYDKFYVFQGAYDYYLEKSDCEEIKEEQEIFTPKQIEYLQKNFKKKITY